MRFSDIDVVGCAYNCIEVLLYTKQPELVFVSQQLKESSDWIYLYGKYIERKISHENNFIQNVYQKNKPYDVSEINF